MYLDFSTLKRHWNLRYKHIYIMAENWVFYLYKQSSDIIPIEVSVGQQFDWKVV